ncbi:hypothetical protein GCM10018783_35800 [Streptomyces griseosporeus]|nr:hypothetical protein GCM10018783_35800 [Streptomyces griseosporeus]
MTGYDRGAASAHRPAVWEGPDMILEALGSAVLGLVLSWAALHRLAHRLPARPLVLATGVAGALFGDFVTHSALGPGNAALSLVGAAIVSSASLSLLLRPAGRLRRSAPA